MVPQVWSQMPKRKAQVTLNFTFSVSDIKVLTHKGVAFLWHGWLECLSFRRVSVFVAADCWRDAQVWSLMQSEQRVLSHYRAERSLCSSKRGHGQSASHTPQSSTPFVHPVAFHTGRRVSLCVKGLLKVHVSKARSAYCGGKNIDFYIMCVKLMCGFFLTFDRIWLNRKMKFSVLLICLTPLQPSARPMRRGLYHQGSY